MGVYPPKEVGLICLSWLVSPIFRDINADRSLNVILDGFMTNMTNNTKRKPHGYCGFNKKGA
jgi:hypothetical protein